MLTDPAIAFIEARGLSVELATRLGITSSVGSDGGSVLVFPFTVGGDVVNHKYRKLPKAGFYQDEGGQKTFWNFNAILDPTLASEPVIITEGEFDAMAALQCGYLRTVSVPDGAPAQEIGAEESRKYGYLEHARSALKDCREIIICSDGDGPGQNLLNDLAIRLGKPRCKWVKYPKGCKDLNDVLLRYGERGVHETIRRAQWFRVDGVYRMSELPPYPDRQQYLTGFEWLNDHYRIRMGDFCVVTGRPGDGKSTWVNDLLCRTVDKHGWVVAVASFEQHPQADHRRALREWYCRCPLSIAPDFMVEEADKWIDEHFVFIVPDDDDLANLAWTLDKCAAAVIRHGVRIVVIDPWNELDHDRPHDMSLTEYTGKAIKEFKRLARSLDVHVIVVAHPTKLQANEKPGLYSISDSAHWANKPDIGIVLWKPSPESERAELRVVKSRYHDQIGRPGTVWMRYERGNRRFLESPPPEDTN